MDAFDQFWASYPRRDARKDAQKAWKQVNGDKHIDAILAALAWQAPEYLSREKQYRPLPSTYLRGERWNDEHPDAVVAIVRTVSAAHEADAAAARKAEAERINALNEARNEQWLRQGR